MLKQLIIENFRCFEKIQIYDFARVNLIGGKNNAGKTALLEALLLQHSPNPSSIFRLSIELDTQIFATTHSLEMIQAFKDVGLEKYPDMGAYFELTKKHKTDRIIAIPSNINELDYALEHERPIRG